MLPQDLPAQFDAPALAGRAVGGTPQLSGSEGGLGHLHDMGVMVVAEQLRAGNTTQSARFAISSRTNALGTNCAFLSACLSVRPCYLMTDVSRELSEIVFDSYVSCPSDVLPPAAYMADFPDQGVIQVAQQTPPPGPVLSVST